MEKTWAIVELMGHAVIAGEVSEEEIASNKFLRVDVPENGDIPKYTKFYGSSAIYAITPTDEATARHALQSLQVRPVAQYILPRQLPAPEVNGNTLVKDGDEKYALNQSRLVGVDYDDDDSWLDETF